MGPELGPAAPDDAPALARIARESFPDPWPEAAFRDQLRRRDRLARCAGRPFASRAGRQFGWVARDELGSAIAYVLGLRVLDEAQVLSLAVSPGWRRCGIASSLLRSALDALREQGVSSVTLEVRASNLAARALYRRLGFNREGERRGYYPGGESAFLLGVRL
ncbi:MAG: GNAT family N-acetyltransferase [Myxococcota bacterium]